MCPTPFCLDAESIYRPNRRHTSDPFRPAVLRRTREPWLGAEVFFDPTEDVEVRSGRANARSQVAFVGDDRLPKEWERVTPGESPKLLHVPHEFVQGVARGHNFVTAEQPQHA